MSQTKITKTILTFLLFLPLPSWAASFDYTPLEKIPGFEAQTTGDFYVYISLVYKFGIWAVGIAALLMISIGGYMYVTSAGNNSSMEKAKGVITDAVVGLILALTAYLLLYIINPDLVKITPLPKLAPGGATTTGTGVGAPGAPGASVLPAGTLSQTEAAQRLSAAGINVSSSGNCTDPHNSNCTSLEGIPASTIDNIIRVKTTCNTNVTVTGGTETGHRSHGAGKPIVDFSFNADLGTCLKNRASSLNITTICTTPADQSAYSYNCNYNETARHFHVAFSA